jgi:hypothetical protein
MTVDRETPMLLPPDQPGPVKEVLMEWILVTLSYNLRRLHTLGAMLKAA